MTDKLLNQSTVQMLVNEHTDNNDTNLCRYHIWKQTKQMNGFLFQNLHHYCLVVSNMGLQNYMHTTNQKMHFLYILQMHRSLTSLLHLHMRNNLYNHNTL